MKGRTTYDGCTGSEKRPRRARWWLGALAIIKATAADTGGTLTVLDVTDPPWVKAPLHVHHREDEAFWVLEGE